MLITKSNNNNWDYKTHIKQINKLIILYKNNINKYKLKHPNKTKNIYKNVARRGIVSIINIIINFIFLIKNKFVINKAQITLLKQWQGKQALWQKRLNKQC